MCACVCSVPSIGQSPSLQRVNFLQCETVGVKGDTEVLHVNFSPPFASLWAPSASLMLNGDESVWFQIMNYTPPRSFVSAARLGSGWSLCLCGRSKLIITSEGKREEQPHSSERQIRNSCITSTLALSFLTSHIKACFMTVKKADGCWQGWITCKQLGSYQGSLE